MDTSTALSQTRTKKAKYNIVIALLLKGLSLLISFILIPLTIEYLSPYEYGVWLTLSSLLHWMDFMDIGLGNGLRNRLSESLAKNDIELSKSYISTTFFALIVIMMVFFVIFAIVGFYVDWYSLLNVSNEKIHNLLAIVIIVTAMMSINFVMKITTYVYFAKQVPMINNLIPFLSQLLSLCFIYLLTKTTDGNLLIVASIYSASPVIVLLGVYPITFYLKYKELAPSIKYVNLSYLKSLLGMGMEFFFLKIGGMLIFSTSNIIISNVLTPEEVTPYGISYKYYSIVTMVFIIIITPMWSATTDAFVKKDYEWIKSSSKNMMKICFLMVLVTVLLTIYCDFIYGLWINKMVDIPISLNVIFAIYVTIVNISTCYSHFIFGIGRLRLQIFSTLFSGVLFIIITPYLLRTQGINGAALSLCIANLPAMILNPIQFYILLNNKKKYNKIWYK